MPLSRILVSALAACAAFLLTTWDPSGTTHAQTASKATPTVAANPITGEGLPNPAPKVTRNWGELPAGGSGARRPASTSIRRTATSGATSAAARARPAAGPVDCDNNPGRSGLQVRPPHRQGARELRQGRHGDAARHLTSTRTATCGLPTSRATRTAPRDTRCTSSARRARSC